MKKVLVLADLHVGSDEGACSEEVDLGPKKSVYRRNEIQEIITDKLYADIERAGKVDVLALNGDLADGNNYRGRGEFNWTTSFEIQTDEVVRLLKQVDLKPNATVLLTKSSGYHGGSNPSVDQMLAHKLRAEGIKAGYHWEQVFKVNDVRFHMSHQVGVAMYYATSIAKELLWSAIHKEIYGDFDIILRSHCHFGYMVSDFNRTGIITPGFKGRDEYVGTIGLRFNPEIGAVMFDIDNTGTGWDVECKKIHLDKDHIFREVQL